MTQKKAAKCTWRDENMPLRKYLDQRDLREMAERIAKRHQVTLDEMFGRGRMYAFVAARHEMMAELYSTGNWSTPRIGLVFGVDHTTVLAAIQKIRGQRHIAALAERDSQVRVAVGVERGAA
jgi:chromosomal replication initiation ATPase DnaA